MASENSITFIAVSFLLKFAPLTQAQCQTVQKMLVNFARAQKQEAFSAPVPDQKQLFALTAKVQKVELDNDVVENISNTARRLIVSNNNNVGGKVSRGAQVQTASSG